MDVVRIFNGLGNQMSQYAFYLAKKKMHPWRTSFISNQYESENVHNGFELERVFGIRVNHLKERILFQFMQSMYFPVWGYRIFGHFAHPIEETPNYDFDPQMLQPAKGLGFNFFWGGWHSEKYFRSIRETLFTVYKFDEKKLNSDSWKWKNQIDKDENSCSIHIRRGDFLNIKKWGEAIPDDYYDKAIAHMRDNFPDMQFYVFSNDMEWCKSRFGSSDFHYIDCNAGMDSWQDMYLMTRCRHHINANSTFSWWGAWLCTYPDSITIVPKRFRADIITKDIYPERWVKL